MADKKVRGSNSKQQEIKKKTKLILESSKHANLLVDILAATDTDEEEITLAFIKSVHKIFSSFLKDKKLVQKKSVENIPEEEKRLEGNQEENPEDVFGSWLYEKYLAVLNKLSNAIHHDSTNVQELSLCTLMKFLAAEQEGLPKMNSLFPSVLFGKIFDELVNIKYNMSALIERFSEFLEYDDIRYYSLKHVIKALENPPLNTTFYISNIYSLLSLVKLPTSDEDMAHFLAITDKGVPSKKGKDGKPDVFCLKMHKKLFGKAWLSFLSNPLKSDMHKKVLLNLHTDVIPYMNDPKLLMDFLTDSYNSGGVISLLALNGVFILIHQHNLDYPDFYKKLYALLEPGIFHVKYQSRFFHLLDLFLTSTHLPAYLVAAFCKRLARLALSAPPQGVILAITFVGNLIKRHPSCQVLLHKKEVPTLLLNEKEESSSETCLNADNYDPYEPDPSKCNALQSSLWELKTLENHFYPKMQSLIESFNKPLDKIEVDISKHFDVGYDDLFMKHLVNVTENNAIMEYQAPKGIFGNNDCEWWNLES